MKYLVITAIHLMVSIQASAGVSIADIKFSCSGKAQVTQASDFHHSPGLPPRGRFPGLASFSSMTLEIEVLSKSEGCKTLEDKYDYDFKNMKLHAGVHPAESKHELSKIPIVGKIIDFNFSQHYKYVNNKKFLPFYPDLFEESVHIATSPIVVSGYKISGGNKIEEINTHEAHDSTPINQKTDTEKMEIAKAVLNLSQFSSYNSMFGQSLLELEPTSKNLKPSYVKLLWGYLHQLKVNNKAPYGFFNFHVGGIGSFEGAPLSSKILQLQSKHQALTDQETIDYIVELPTALLASNSQSCANISDEMMEEVIETIHSKLPILTNSEQHQVKSLVSNGSVGFFICNYNLEVSPQAKKWVDEIKTAVSY